MFRVRMGEKVEPRRDFIEWHALEVRNLGVYSIAMEKRTTIFSLRTLLIVVSLAGPCIALPFFCYRGTIVDYQSRSIKIGMTQAEVAELCGLPAAQETYADGTIVWQYYLHKFVPLAFVNPLCVRFNQDGKVQGIWLH